MKPELNLGAHWIVTPEKGLGPGAGAMGRETGGVAKWGDDQTKRFTKRSLWGRSNNKCTQKCPNARKQNK